MDYFSEYKKWAEENEDYLVGEYADLFEKDLIRRKMYNGIYKIKFDQLLVSSIHCSVVLEFGYSNNLNPEEIASLKDNKNITKDIIRRILNGEENSIYS